MTAPPPAPPADGRSIWEQRWPNMLRYALSQTPAAQLSPFEKRESPGAPKSCREPSVCRLLLKPMLYWTIHVEEKCKYKKPTAGHQPERRLSFVTSKCGVVCLRFVFHLDE